MGRLARAGTVLAAVAPAALVFYLVQHYGINVPYWDDWELAGPLIRFVNGGGLQWTALFKQHNEHRMIFPKLVMLLIAVPTRWNVVAQMTANVMLVAITLSILIVLARPVLARVHPIARVWAAFILSAMLFSLRQSENWLWAWQVQWFLAALAAVSAIALATRSLRSPRPYLHVAGAAGAAIVCHYSVASGVAIWISGALILAFHPLRRRILPLWLAVAAVATAVYLIGYARGGGLPSLKSALEQPANFLTYFANYAAGPLGQHAVFGLVAVAAFAALVVVALARFRQTPELVLPWIALGAFAVMSAAATSVGRAGFGAEHGLASRYVTLGLLLPVAMVPLGMLCFEAWPAWRRPKARVMTATGAAALLTLLVVRADFAAFPAFAKQHEQMSRARHCVRLLVDATDDCLKLAFPEPMLVRHYIKHLRAFGWSGFLSSDLRLTDRHGTRLWQLRGEDSAIGWIGPVTLEDRVLTVKGWARHPDGNAAETRKVLIVGGSSLLGEADVVVERPDIVRAFDDPNSLRSGWIFRVENFSTAGVPLHLEAYLVFREGVLIPLDGHGTVIGQP